MLNSKIFIENEYSLQTAFKEGINLFVGAGFSIYAKDGKNRKLPLGQELAKELAIKFNKTQYDLVRISTLLEKTVRSEFYAYLIQRFSVKEFDLSYNALNKINIKTSILLILIILYLRLSQTIHIDIFITKPNMEKRQTIKLSIIFPFMAMWMRWSLSSSLTWSLLLIFITTQQEYGHF